MTSADIIQFGLIVVLITQTIYLAKQTNFFKRSSQANLVETWRKELRGIEFRSLLTDLPELPNETEFEKLVGVLHRMHFLFKEKLLKPSDFSIFFIILYMATLYVDFRKTQTYKDSYLKLQSIFNDFNDDVDAILYPFTMPTTSMYEKIMDQIPTLKKNNLTDLITKNWKHALFGFKIHIWFTVKIRRKHIFALEPPVEQ
jgi:hypothetical protein